MNIGIKIREARKIKKITQQELADAIGITRNYISDLENDRYVPSVKTLAKVSKFLNIDLNFLTQNDGNTIQ